MRSRIIPALCAFVALAAFSACGGDDVTAESLVPELGDIGLQIAQEGPDPVAPDDAGIYRALYADPADDGRAIVTVIYVKDDEDAAVVEYHSLSRALENPPPDFFGADAEQAETEPIAVGDEQTAFVTADADSRGRRVWTDVYRSGRTVLITQVLGSDDEDQAATRTLVAERVFEDAP